jgi:hypothetical protein
MVVATSFSREIPTSKTLSLGRNKRIPMCELLVGIISNQK